MSRDTITDVFWPVLFGVLLVASGAAIYAVSYLLAVGWLTVARVWALL